MNQYCNILYSGSKHELEGVLPVSLANHSSNHPSATSNIIYKQCNLKSLHDLSIYHDVISQTSVCTRHLFSIGYRQQRPLSGVTRTSSRRMTLLITYRTWPEATISCTDFVMTKEGGWRRLHSEEFRNLYAPQNEDEWVGHVAYMGEMKIYTIFCLENLKGKGHSKT